MPFVYAFDHPHETPPMDLKDLLGGKGANLAEMTSVLDLPVPPGFTITTDACRRPTCAPAAGPPGSTTRSPSTSGRIERAMGRRLGDPDDPLLVSVRSGAKFSMPGMMDTVLNLGLNDAVGRRAWPPRPATSGSPSTRTAGSWPCSGASSSTSTAPCSTVCSTTPSAWPA